MFFVRRRPGGGRRQVELQPAVCQQTARVDITVVDSNAMLKRAASRRSNTVREYARRHNDQERAGNREESGEVNTHHAAHHAPRPDNSDWRYRPAHRA